MKIFDFDLPTDQHVIIVNAPIGGKFKSRLAIDTAATYTPQLIATYYIFLGMNLKIAKANKNKKHQTELS
jgi:hypothetical protein